MRANSASDAKVGNIMLFKPQSHSLKLVGYVEKLRKPGRLCSSPGFWVNTCLAWKPNHPEFKI